MAWRQTNKSVSSQWLCYSLTLLCITGLGVFRHEQLITSLVSYYLSMPWRQLPMKVGHGLLITSCLTWMKLFIQAIILVMIKLFSVSKRDPDHGFWYYFTHRKSPLREHTYTLLKRFFTWCSTSVGNYTQSDRLPVIVISIKKPNLFNQCLPCFTCHIICAATG